jgi:polyphosphate kinase
MERNFFRRIEVCFPIQRESHRQRVFSDLELYLADNVQAWILQADGSYARATPGDGPSISAQMELLETIAD